MTPLQIPTHKEVRDADQQEEEVVHFAETGFSMIGNLHKLHSAYTALPTHSGTHAKHGKTAADAIGILPQLQGRSICDRWASYFR